MRTLLAISLCVVGLAPTARCQLFSDDFNRTTLPPWAAQSGSWTVSGGVMRGGVNATYSYGVAYITNNFTNFSVQAEFQFPAGAYGGGLGGRLNTSSGAHYAAWVYPEGSDGGSKVLKLLRFDGYGSYTLLRVTNLTAVGTSPHTVKLEFAGNLINVYFDSNRLLSANDATYASGAVSLDMWTDATGYQMTVDNVAVSPLQLVAGNDTYAAISGVPLRVSVPGVLVNDSGGLGPLSAVLVSVPAHGTFTLTNNGGFTYTATNGYTGADSFTYRATDGVSTSSVATASITVTANHAPVANNDTYTVMQDTSLSLAAPGVLGNDTDPDGDRLTAVLVSGVTEGALSWNTNGDGGFTYTPMAGFAGTESFTYRAYDGVTNSAETTVTISVVSIVPLYADNFTRTVLSPWVRKYGTWTVSNYELQASAPTALSYGAAYLTDSYTNYYVQANIQFPAGAFGGGVDACLNPATGARYAAWVYPEGSPGGSKLLKLLKFQTWDTFKYNNQEVPMRSVNLAAVGTSYHTLKLACAGNRIKVFFDGTLMISTTDTDSGAQPYTNGAIGASFWAANTGPQMWVDDVLVVPLADEDNYSVMQDTTLNVAAPGVLANDTQMNGSTLTAALVTGPTNGTLNFTTNGGFSYTPAAGFVGTDAFRYRAMDGVTDLGTALVKIAVISSASGIRVFSENFDHVTPPALPSGWTTVTNGAGTRWLTSTSARHTLPNAAYAAEPATTSTSDLVSPAIALPPGQMFLAFRHNYDLEVDAYGQYDGGVLEVSIGGGAFTDILAAGGIFLNGGYDSTISTLYGNPLMGRQAWSGNSGGFVNTVVTLPSAATNQTIQLRWRCGTDNGGVSGAGWYVDTVAITNCACNCCWNSPPLLASQADRTIEELTTLTVTNTATDIDLPPQTLTYTLLNAPAGAVITTNGVISWTPTEAQGPGTYTLRTKVTDNGSPALSATNSFTVVVSNVNSAPVLPAQADRTVLELTALTVNNAATDSDLPANTLTYSLLAAPPNAAIGANTGIIYWTPTEAQGPSTNIFVARVVDNGSPVLTATNTFTVVVNESNTPPVLPAQTNRAAGVSITLTVTNTATDTDLPANSLTYALLAGPTNAVIDPGTGIISWTPTPEQDRTTNLFTTVVTDSSPDAVNAKNLSATNSFTVSVFSGQPTIVLDSTALVAEGFAPTNNAVDPGETVILRFALKNVGTAHTANLLATLLPTNGVVSPSAPQTYGVVPAGGAAVSQTYTFTASGVCGGSITPTLQLQDGSTNLGTLAVSFFMGQPGTVWTQNFDSVTAPALPADWSTTRSGYQSNWVTVTALSDTAPNAAYATDATNVGLSELRSPLILLPLGPAQLSFRHRYAFEAEPLSGGSGWDGGVLEIQIGTNAFVDITNGGSWVANGYNRQIATGYANPLAGRWAWSGTNGAFVTTTVNLPLAAAGQTIQLRWRAGTDNGNGGGGWWVDSLAITGNGCAANNPPVLPSQANRTIDELTTLIVTNTANDPGSPPQLLTYALINPPPDAVISADGIITWTPTEAQGPGSYTFTTLVSDSALPSATATNSFTVTVDKVNSAPSLTLPASQTINEQVLWTANASATDTDVPTNTLTCELVSGPTGLTVSPAGLISWTPTEAQGPSTNLVTVRVFDDGLPSLSTTNSFTLTVNEVNSAPSLTVPANQTITEQVLWTANASATDTDVPTNTLTCELVSGPTGLTVSPAGLVSWTPSAAQGSSTNTVVLRAFDNGLPSLAVTNMFVLKVIPVTNAPPIVIQSINASNGAVTVTWSAVTNHTYRLEYKASLRSTNWVDLVPEVVATGSTASYTDYPAGASQRYYRVLLVATTPMARPVIRSLIGSLAGAGTTNVVITWSAMSNRTYRLAYKTDLDTTNWFNLAPDVTATSSSASFTDHPAAERQRFYRVELLP